jgi:tRNA modification GTPase
VERIGIEVTGRYLRRADLVLLCVSATAGIAEGEKAFLEQLDDVPVVLLETKADLTPERSPGGAGEGRRDDWSADGVAAKLRTSTLSGQGLDQLREVLPELAYSSMLSAGPEAPVLTRRRHAEGLRRARAEVSAFREALGEGLPPEVAAAHLRPAETALEEILGVISMDDVLDVVFAEFCVGK